MKYLRLVFLLIAAVLSGKVIAAQASDTPQGALLVPIMVEIRTDAEGTPIPLDFKMQIFRLTTDGEQRFQLTHTAFDETDPQWSPDGEQIVFVSKRDGTDQIYVMDADGSNPHNLSNQPGKYHNRPAWSPEGSQIMFSTSSYDQEIGANFFEIWVMDADGSNPRNLSSDHLHSDFNAVWSPDGQQIAFTGMTPDQSSSAIWLIDVDGRNATALTAPEGKDSSPQWSPDGQQIVYKQGGYIEGELWIMDADGANNRALSTETAYIRQIAWSPDGEQIAFTDSPNGVNELFIMDADGENLRQVAPERGIADLDFAWSPDSTQILATVNLMSPDLGRLMLIDVASGERTLIVDDAYCGYKPDWRTTET